MTLYFWALVLLSGGTFIHTQSNVPELRPADERADAGWRWLARVSLWAWVAMLAWGCWALPWQEPAMAFLGSLGLNAYFGWRGPRPAWPAMSMLLCGVGLLLAAYRLAA